MSKPLTDTIGSSAAWRPLPTRSAEEKRHKTKINTPPTCMCHWAYTKMIATVTQQQFCFQFVSVCLYLASKLGHCSPAFWWQQLNQTSSQKEWQIPLWKVKRGNALMIQITNSKGHEKHCLSVWERKNPVAGRTPSYRCAAWLFVSHSAQREASLDQH